MRIRITSLPLACVAWALAVGHAAAMEADQFTIPPQPLADTGPEVQAMVKAVIERLVNECNVEARAHLDRADELPAKSQERQWRLEQAGELLSERHLARQIRDALGKGFPKSKIEHMISDATFAAQPAVFELTCEQSIFKDSGLARPLLLVGMVPTVNLFGVYQGTDKLGHFFEEGYEYSDIYLAEMRRGRSEEHALKAAIRHGVDEERGVYGYIPSGAYSNADLAANYAGFIFYLNLTRPVIIGRLTRPPILLNDGRGWRFNNSVGEDLLRPFISDHFDEAMNPAVYDWTMRDSIRNEVRARADRWLAFHHSTCEAEAPRLMQLRTWYGADYGHADDGDLITIAGSCTPAPGDIIAAGSRAAKSPSTRGGPATKMNLSLPQTPDLSR